MRDTVHDLPLTPLLRTESQGSAILTHRINGGSLVQTSPQLFESATIGAAAATPIGNGKEPGVREMKTEASPPPIDLDELVEKAWQKLMHKLTIEQERRGCTRWL